ncbi:hypothetical protein SAMN04487891_11441 [Flagellimonas taeanensis]|uniref:Uncharacterized protein n=1 Tax=Flagellimonas taeanensis TaxID=1005926 RepID=A0A1M6VZC3_9FLAO|nr:hypothetical protein SAMN04487891_11441 [Allomuricauda taeanensis]SHK86758.1 hypothetical protein SAMN05216293_2095 [Allomuricauda taeanensis]
MLAFPERIRRKATIQKEILHFVRNDKVKKDVMLNSFQHFIIIKNK